MKLHEYVGEAKSNFEKLTEQKVDRADRNQYGLVMLRQGFQKFIHNPG